MDARSFRKEAEKAHQQAEALRHSAQSVQQNIVQYTQSGDFTHARSEQDRVSKLEEEAIAHERQAMDYEQRAIKLEHEAAELDRQLTQLTTHFERQAHDLESRIKQLLG